MSTLHAALAAVTEWLDDDHELRIPSTEWGHRLYDALRLILAAHPAPEAERGGATHLDALADTGDAYTQRKGWSLHCLWCDYVTPVEPTRAKALVWMQKHYNAVIPEGVEIR